MQLRGRRVERRDSTSLQRSALSFSESSASSAFNLPLRISTTLPAMPPATPTGHAPDWWLQFDPFTLQHALAAGVCTALMFIAAFAGRRWRETLKEKRLRHAWGWGIVAFQSFALGYWLLPAHFTLRNSLPLHLCDLAVWAAAIAMLTEQRWARTLLYFWGIGLSTQAFLTPTLNHGIATPEFWLFWIGHTQIVGSAVYDILARGYRPRVRDLLVGTLGTALWAAAAFAVNLALDLNYGYIGNADPSQPTIIDRLGPWPLRILWIALIVQALYIALWAVWPLGERLRARVARSAGS